MLSITGLNHFYYVRDSVLCIRLIYVWRTVSDSFLE